MRERFVQRFLLRFSLCVKITYLNQCQTFFLVPEERLSKSLSPNHALILRFLLNVYYHVIRNARPPMVYHLVYYQAKNKTLMLCKSLWVSLTTLNLQCLYPENNTRTVQTASNIQIRQKMYKGSSKEWKNFEHLLNGVFDPLYEMKD